MKCLHPRPHRRSLVPLTHTPTRSVSFLGLAPHDCCGAPCRRAAAASPARGQTFHLSAAPLPRQRPPYCSAALRLTQNLKMRRRHPWPEPSAPAMQATCRCRRHRRRRHCRRFHRCQPRRGGGGGVQCHVGGSAERRGGYLPSPPPTSAACATSTPQRDSARRLAIHGGGGGRPSRNDAGGEAGGGGGGCGCQAQLDVDIEGVGVAGGVACTNSRSPGTQVMVGKVAEASGCCDFEGVTKV